MLSLQFCKTGCTYLLYLVSNYWIKYPMRCPIRVIINNITPKTLIPFCILLLSDRIQRVIGFRKICYSLVLKVRDCSESQLLSLCRHFWRKQLIDKLFHLALRVCDKYANRVCEKQSLLFQNFNVHLKINTDRIVTF